MSKRIYVGNLPFSASDEEIRTTFSEHGTVALGIDGDGSDRPLAPAIFEQLAGRGGEVEPLTASSGRMRLLDLLVRRRTCTVLAPARYYRTTSSTKKTAARTNTTSATSHGTPPSVRPSDSDNAFILAPP